MILADQIQLEIFNLAANPAASKGTTHMEGRQLRDRGMERAIDHAGSSWTERAFCLLREFLSPLPQHRRFMTEQIRGFAYGRGLERPPSERAWGGVTMRAAKEGLMIKVGFAAVTNSKAHMANAAVWRKC